MKFCIPISNRKVFAKAINLVGKAEKEILVTMDVDEERKRPLPQGYHNLIAKKCQEGVLVTRIGFGTKEAFYALRRIHPRKPNFIFIYGGPARGYQRMLVVDKSAALCRLGDQNFCTKFKPFVQSLVIFFEILYNKRR